MLGEGKFIKGEKLHYFMFEMMKGCGIFANSVVFLDHFQYTGKDIFFKCVLIYCF